MPKPTPGAVALDSCILIDLFDATSTHREDIRQMYADAEKDKLLFVISTMVHAEVAAKNSEVTVGQIWDIRRAMAQSFFEPVELSVPLGLLASDLARAHSLKPPDAIHAATCVTKGVEWLITRDKKLLKVDNTIHLNASDHSKRLRIVTPKDFCDEFYRPLFAIRAR